ncbi:TetR/AcrR family transcriptional regulator [Streptomyces sp. DSM 44915]|uniref:TetR/AcrR family transcriptional regulator n=1 Tax=Streptomyces chisholmiae TaxID=3075540 RepID=A0ABU2JIT9_9ACTN|nr:TetR/AcrR family transcriptional regulator [Streptomyces sp. DSM 44915]MDT0264899.1 TetR/AcrR family transcriptional regulator [Streptomyces sp. DSM 44915]
MADTTETGPGDRAGRPTGRADARRNRERLLAAAEEVFATSGPTASLNQIARRAGVGPGTLYRHFPGRDALLAGVLDERIDRLTRRADALLTAPEADRALADWLAAFLDHARSQQGLGSALLLARSSEFGLDCHHRLRAAAGALLDRAQASGGTRPDITTDEMLRLVVGVALATVETAADDAAPGPAEDPPPTPQRLLGLVLDALGGPAPPQR